MEFVKGISVVPGIAIGKVLVLDMQDFLSSKRFIFKEEVDREKTRFRTAVKNTISSLSQLSMKMDDKVGGELALIFKAHIGILEDSIFQQDVEKAISQKLLSAEYAVSLVLRKLEKALRDVSDEYLSQRATDIADIGKRLQNALAGSEAVRLDDIDEPIIIVARDLTPSQLAGFDHNNIAGVALDRGGLSSHTSILLRAFEIPSVIGLEKVSTDVSSTEMAIVEGGTGLVILRPTEEVLERYDSKKNEFAVHIAKLKKEGIIPAVTLDGKKITVTANIEFPEEIGHALEFGLEGIGLYRTEYLYLTLNREPDEEDHFKAYKKAVDSLDGKPIVLRTLDLGADKLFSRDVLLNEANPFLGFRSIRMFLSEKQEVLKLQLRAMLRASNYGNVKILFPMISSLGEIREAKSILQEVMDDLDAAKIPYDEDIQIGIMIEVPSIAMVSDIAAKEVDFFSLGTNDLIQFSLAVDRTNDKVSYLFQPLEVSILRIIKTVIDNAHTHGIETAMCGEMSGDPMNTILLLGMGLDEFSVAPASGPLIKHVIRNVELKQAENIAHKALKITDHSSLHSYLLSETKKLIPDMDVETFFK
mgnify:CR=1 FL=1